MVTKCMTEQEYLERLSGLFEKIRAEAAPTDDETILFERYQDAEFTLTIDYRLGADFPPERRAALRAVHQRTQERTEELKKQFLASELSNQQFAAAMQAAVEVMAKDYGTVLTAEEMTAFFGGGENAFRLALTPEAL